MQLGQGEAPGDQTSAADWLWHVELVELARRGVLSLVVTQEVASRKTDTAGSHCK